MPRVTVRVPLRPTELPDVVRGCITNLFPDVDVRETADGFEADVADVSRLRELVRAQRIPDTARGAILAGRSSDGTRLLFRLGKQAAAAGRAHFGALGGPLGEVEVEVADDDAMAVERWAYHVAPDTTVPLDLAEVPPALRPHQGDEPNASP